MHMPLKKSNISIERFDVVVCVLRQNRLKAYHRVVSREALAGTKIAGIEYRAALVLGAGVGVGTWWARYVRLRRSLQ